MEYISAKTIVTRTKAPAQWFGIDYNMNIYKGCCHGCIYCDSRSECYGVEDFDKVKDKIFYKLVNYDKIRYIKRSTSYPLLGFSGCILCVDGKK